MGRPPCCDKSDVKKGLWTAEEDAKLLAYTTTHGTKNWTSVPKKAGLKRCGKSCRLRWTNYLRPNLKRESFTPQEEEMIVTLHATFGSRWSIIAQQLPGRTDNDIKNYWNTKLSKKLCQRGIDPVTHHPISEVIQSLTALSAAPAANSCITSTRFNSASHNYDARLSCLNRDLKNVFLTGLAAAPAVSVQLPLMQQLEEESSSSSSTAASDKAPPPPPSPEICWNDFLAEDAFLPLDQVQGDVVSVPVKIADGGHGDQAAKMGDHVFQGHELVTGGNYCEEGEEEVGMMMNGSSSSFVDAIMDHDWEMMSDFPRFLGDSYDFL